MYLYNYILLSYCVSEGCAEMMRRMNDNDRPLVCSDGRCRILVCRAVVCADVGVKNQRPAALRNSSSEAYLAL